MNPFWSNIFRKPGYEGTLAYFLGTVPPFSALGRRDLNFLETLIHLRNYHPGETIFSEGDIGSGMYIIRSGGVRIDMKDEQGQNKVQANLEAGDFFGEIALTTPMPRIGTATATEQTVLAGLFRADVLDALRKHPAIASKILLGLNRILSERLQHAGLRLHGLSYAHLEPSYEEQ
ncbi:cyclic nucleotide-binding domain-containing protein [Geopsychrobacter electrodiphilus]|uniref:cyclic nucleotide-binding domain-containing protein n=1 Tax=Geopsychrobacter electrodiphilus TaxID=225196 RepID=UPI00036AA09F|nr:cyclic nucleotide-binding domain-containing protein [Geopsychrobacter electrodiphilus]